MRYLATCVARKKRIFGTDPKLALLGLKPRAETCRPLVGAISRLIPCKCPNSRALRAVKQAAETEAFDNMLPACLWPKASPSAEPHLSARAVS